MQAISKFEVNPRGKVLFRFVGKGKHLKTALRQAMIMYEFQKRKSR